MPYERTRVYECHYCRGILVENTKIPRIIVRTEKVCTDRLKSLARAVATDNQKKLSLKRLRGEQRASKSLLICPGCQSPMMRTFYSLAYLIEIDRCNYCNLTWFDADELEMLQYLIENRITPALNIGT